MSLERSSAKDAGAGRESPWVIYAALGFNLAFAFLVGADLVNEVATPWRLTVFFLFALFAGIWLAQTRPLIRFMAWRARRYGLRN